MARFLVEKAAAKARTADELFIEIAATIPARAEREAFLAKKTGFLRIAAQEVSKAKAVAVGGESSGEVAVSQGTGELTRENVAKASEIAARYLGPVAKILAERAARRTDTLRGLYAILAGHLKEGPERSQFLRDAGYPES
jgi:serine/threonine-protein kinase